MTAAQRRALLDELYRLLDMQARAVGGPRRLGDCTGRDAWPDAGVYLFFEPGELREDGHTPRVVRVGTHAISSTSRTTLWTRLRTHRGRVGGSNLGGGNHRASVFRRHVGAALLAGDGFPEARETWGVGSSAPRGARDRERTLEREVSRRLAAMRILCLGVPSRNDRAAMERGLIALLSNADREPIDPPSRDWLGLRAPSPAVRSSGLWNVRQVQDPPDAQVLDLVSAHVLERGAFPLKADTVRGDGS